MRAGIATRLSSFVIDHNMNYDDSFFVDAASRDFHLQSNSPAIDAGTDVGLTSDFDGNPIVGTPDIRAFGYQP